MKPSQSSPTPSGSRTPDPHNENLQRATALHQQGQLPEAGALYRDILKSDPNCFDALHMLAVLTFQSGNVEDANALFLKAKGLNPGDASIHFNYGVMLQKLNKSQEALLQFKTTISINPGHPEAHQNSAIILRGMKRLEEAIESHRSAISLRPNYANAHFTCGETLQTMNRFEEAVSSYDEAIALKPEYAEAYHNRGIALRELGRFQDSLLSSVQAIKIKPDHLDAYSNFLFTSNFIQNFSPRSRLEKARQFGIQASKGVEEKTIFSGLNAPGMKKRIGFVSGDFKNHPVGYFTISLFENIDRSKFEIYAYSNNAYEDSLTLRLKKSVSRYQDITNQTDIDAARLIHRDGIHILIDLSGHTALNRLPLFARKQAPIQASWLGYCGTTGIAQIDYMIGDQHVIPPGEEHHFTEKIKRLPGSYFCFSQPDEDMEVQCLPALDNGYVTFGSFNNHLKLTPEVIQLWAKILMAIEHARIFLKSAQFDDPSVKNHLRETFASLGISQDRLLFEGKTDRTRYFEAYNKIDIALDPFPYPGATTSMEAMWMGVPVLTKKGDSFLSHNGETIAVNAGQSEWVAQNANDYLDKAIRFSSDLMALAQLRSKLRHQVLTSPIYAADQFARNFEIALSEMWADYIAAGASEL